MQSNFHSGVWKTTPHVIPRGRCIAVAAALTTLGVGSVFAQDYDEMNVIPSEDYFDVPTPPINEYVNIGGFQLRVDQTKWGIDLTQNTHGLLGRLKGHDVDIDVIESPRLESLNQIAENMASTKGSSVHIEHVFTSHAIPGVKAVYGEKPSPLQPEYPGDSLFLRKSRGQNDLFRGTCEHLPSRLVRRK